MEVYFCIKLLQDFILHKLLQFNYNSVYLNNFQCREEEDSFEENSHFFKRSIFLAKPV